MAIAGYLLLQKSKEVELQVQINRSLGCSKPLGVDSPFFYRVFGNTTRGMNTTVPLQELLPSWIACIPT